VNEDLGETGCGCGLELQREDGTVLARWADPQHSFEPRAPLRGTVIVVYDGTPICELGGWDEDEVRSTASPAGRRPGATASPPRRLPATHSWV